MVATKSITRDWEISQNNKQINSAEKNLKKSVCLQKQRFKTHKVKTDRYKEKNR